MASGTLRSASMDGSGRRSYDPILAPHMDSLAEPVGKGLTSLRELLKQDSSRSLREIKVDASASDNPLSRIACISSTSCQSAEQEQSCSNVARPEMQSSARVLPLCSPLPARSTDVYSEFVRTDLGAQQHSGFGSFSSTSLTGPGFALEGLRFISRAYNSTGRVKDKKKWWDMVVKRFHKLASADGRLARSDFAACIGMAESAAFASELFDALARRRGEDRQVDSISLESLRDYWCQITDDSFHSRAQLFFDLCDKDSDGRIAEDEVKEMIMLSASSNKLCILEEQGEEYAALIMQQLDEEQLGFIELSQLESLFQSAARSREPNNNNPHATAIPARSRRARPRGVKRPMTWLHRKATYMVLDHAQRVWVLLCWLAAVVGLFTWKFLQYKQRTDFQVMGYCVCTAKGAAETLKLNMGLILLPVCRNSMTWLRSTFLGSIVPFNDNINFHKVIAAGIGLGVAMHAGSHLFCDFPRIAAADHREFMETIAKDFEGRQPSVLDIVLTLEVMTGIVMVALMSIAYLLAYHSFRRNVVRLPWPLHRLTGFNAFWYSHHLFLLVYTILIVHSLYLFLAHDWTQKTTWIYIAVPMILYACERLLRFFRARQYKVNTVKAAIYAGDVLALYMTKPAGFKYESGMYIFLQCPSISPFEWHPFSITSAPDDQHLSVHIRALGDWTHEMTRVFKEALEYSEKKGTLEGDKEHEYDSRFPKLCIDGPYGAPTQDYKKYEVMLLIGVGIGATPFISVVRDVLYRIRLDELKLDSHMFDSSSTFTGSDDSVYSSNTSSDNSCSSPLSMMSSCYGSPSVMEDDALPAALQQQYMNYSPSLGAMKMKKRSRSAAAPTQAYFYWITREQGSFEWFKGIMNEVAETDQRAVIEMHNYLTSVYEEGDARSALIALVQALQHAKNGLDILSGTRVRTHFARPNWRKVFSRIASNHKGARIGVFYCGPSALAKELSVLCTKFSQNGSSKFEFHKENF